MNVEIGAEAAQFPEKEFINGIAVAVQGWRGVLVLVRDIKVRGLKRVHCMVLWGGQELPFAH